MSELEKYLILVVAVWRLTHLFSAEDGPFDLIIKLRKALGSSFLGKLMDCFYCLSLWVAAPLAPFVGRGALEAVFVWLALSGAACLLERATAAPVTFHQPKE